MISTSFAQNNKLNLLNYLNHNLKSIVLAKEYHSKDIRIFPYLLTGIFIAKRIRDTQKLSATNRKPGTETEA